MTVGLLRMLVVGILASTAIHAERPPPDKDLVAGNFAKEAESAIRNKDYAKALALYDRIIREHPRSSSFLIALFNRAVIFSELSLWDKAIDAFDRVLSIELDDLDGKSLMEVYRNCRHKAAIGISDAYEKKRDFQKALRYARAATERYAFQTSCETCEDDERRSNAVRIKRLKALVNNAQRRRH